MRGGLAVFAAAAAAMWAAGCGGNSGGSNSNTGAQQMTLRLTTAGNGLVRGAGADCRASCTAQYPAGSHVHLVAVPDAGASFSGWAGACSGAGDCDVTLDGDRDVTATFSGSAPPPPPGGQRRLTVVLQGKGRVTSSPAGLDCQSPQCTADFADGTSVSLSQTAESGFRFDGWGGGCTGPGGCSVSMTSDLTVYANFVAQAPPPPPPPAQVHLTAAVTGPGTVTGGGLDCGESTAKCDVMVQAGTAVTLTASPGGGTRFFGWGGACSGKATTCQLMPQSDAKVTAEFQSEVLVLAGNDGTNNTVLALNSTRLFWPRWMPGGSAIWSVPKNGGDAVRVASGTASAILADDSYLYWTDQYNVYSVPVGGGQVAQLASGYPTGKLALDELGALYWTVGSGFNSPGTVHRMQNRTDTVLATGQHPTGGIAVDSDWVYFTDYDGKGSVRRVSRKGGAVEALVTCDTDYCFPSAVRVDSQNVYYRDQSGNVSVRSKADGKVHVIPGGNGSAYMYNPDLEVNAFVVFWNWTGGNPPYGIFRANADGSGFAAVDSSNEGTWYALRVDDNAVYYFHGGAIIRRLR